LEGAMPDIPPFRLFDMLNKGRTATLLIDGEIYHSCAIQFDKNGPSCTLMSQVYKVDSIKADYRKLLVQKFSDYIMEEVFHISQLELSRFLLTSFKLALNNTLRQVCRHPGLDIEFENRCLKQEALETGMNSIIHLEGQLRRTIERLLKAELPTLWRYSYRTLWIENDTIYPLNGHEHAIQKAIADIKKAMDKPIFEETFSYEVEFLTNHYLIRELHSGLYDLMEESPSVKRAVQTAGRAYSKFCDYIHKCIEPLEKLSDLQVRFYTYLQDTILPGMLAYFSGLNDMRASFDVVRDSVMQIDSLSAIAAGEFSGNGFELISLPDGSFYIGKHTGPYIVEHLGPLYFKFPDAFCGLLFTPKNVPAAVRRNALPRPQIVNAYGPHMFIREIGKRNQPICMGDTLQRIAADGNSLMAKVVVTLLYAEKVITQGHHSENTIGPYHTLDKPIFAPFKITGNMMKKCKKDGIRISNYFKRRRHEEKITV